MSYLLFHASKMMNNNPSLLTFWGRGPLVHWTHVLGSGVRWPPLRSLDKVQSELASVFDKNGKGVANEPPPAGKM